MNLFTQDWLQVVAPPLLMVIGGIIAWFIKSRTEELRATEERLRQERVKIYTEILAPYIEILSDPTGSQSRVLNRITSLDYKKKGFQLALLGPDEVVRAWSDFLQYIYTRKHDQYEPKELLRLIGRMLLEIRRSLGNKNTKLTELDMFRWLIKDIQTIEQS